jgi:hypothetical protein
VLFSYLAVQVTGSTGWFDKNLEVPGSFVNILILYIVDCLSYGMLLIDQVLMGKSGGFPKI